MTRVEESERASERSKMVGVGVKLRERRPETRRKEEGRNRLMLTLPQGGWMEVVVLVSQDSKEHDRL